MNSPPAVLEEGVQEGVVYGRVLRGHVGGEGVQLVLEQGEHTGVGGPHLRGGGGGGGGKEKKTN